MNNNYKDLIKEERAKRNNENCYDIRVMCDANDGDYIDDTFCLNDITKDELLFLVMCYLNTCSAFGKDRCDENCFGNYIDRDIFFDWLWDYCIEHDLLLFAGMIDYYCHSVDDITITHYVQGAEYNVILPTIDKIFDNETEMKDYMNKLYEQEN